MDARKATEQSRRELNFQKEMEIFELQEQQLEREIEIKRKERNLKVPCSNNAEKQNFQPSERTEPIVDVRAGLTSNQVMQSPSLSTQYLSQSES